MTKSELKTGMQVKNSKNSLGIVLRGTPHGDLIIWYKNSNTGKKINKYRMLDTINENLTFKDGGRIITVYEPISKREYIDSECELDGLAHKIVYREVIKEVTLADIEKKFGCKVKIVNS